MTTEIQDFTDLALPIDFKYEGIVYRIPAFNKPQLKKLMSLTSKLRSDEKEENKEKESESGEFLDVQDEMLIVGVLKQKEDNTFEAITMDLIDSWPMRLKNKIMDLINRQMSNISGDDESEKK